MLYRCDCQPFNIANNNYRKFFVALATSYSKYFLSSNKSINTIMIVLFEPGGLLDEALIIEEILLYIATVGNNISVIISIVESYKEEYNASLKKAQDYFYTKFINYKQIVIHYYSDVSSLKKQIELLDFDYLLFLTLDPYEYLYLQYYKNEKEDLLVISTKSFYFLDIALYSINSFFYDIELSFLVVNKIVFENLFFKYRLFGKNNLIRYAIKSINTIQ